MSSSPASKNAEVTDTNLRVPWLPRLDGQRLMAPHLVVQWFFDEPERVGQVARIDDECWLGRHHDPSGQVPPLRFVRQRPGQCLATAELSTSRISRRQLEFKLLGKDQVHVHNVGKRSLYVNGRRTEACTLTFGDTLVIEHTAVFLIEERPLSMPPLLHYPGEAFEFGQPDAHGMVGESPAAWQLREQLASAAASDAHVLLFGETGAGKEVAARVIHELSPRSRGPLVARNAATIPGTLLDAELFGNAKNYPNATSPERQGLVGAAHGGNLLLDEIGELPQAHQAHLLRVLDSGGAYHRLGETRARFSEFRLIAATNRDLGCLKHDFFARFRQRVATPGLNQRKSDIPLLLNELVRRLALSAPRALVGFVDPETPGRARVEPQLVDALTRHHYTQHTRELARLLQVSIATSSGGYLGLTKEVVAELERVPRSIPAPEPAAPQPSKERARAALLEAHGNVTRAAEDLGLSRHALRRLMKRYGLGRSDSIGD